MRSKLLLADDSPTIQRVIELTFADEDFDVICVSDGQQAIERIEAERPDVVLADVEMPERNGYEVSMFVKENAELAHIPVVLLTGAFEPIDERRADQARADAVLAKPFEPQAVVEQVRALVARPAGASAPAVDRTPTAAVADEPAVTSSTSTDDAVAAASASAPETAIDETEPSAGESVDEYLDRLDAAFATLGASSAAASVSGRSSGETTVEESVGADAIGEVATESDASVTAAAGVSTGSGLLRSVEPGPEVEPQLERESERASGAAGGGIPVTPVEPEAADGWDAGEETDRPGAASDPEASGDSPVPVMDISPESPPAEHETPAAGRAANDEADAVSAVTSPEARAPLADAFAALLAAEQGESGAEVGEASAIAQAGESERDTFDRIADRVLTRLGDRLPSPATIEPTQPAISDELVERVAQRVIEKMSDRAVRETVADVVLTVADRLVREEIDRIKSEVS